MSTSMDSEDVLAGVDPGAHPAVDERHGGENIKGMLMDSLCVHGWLLVDVSHAQAFGHVLRDEATEGQREQDRQPWPIQESHEDDIDSACVRIVHVEDGPGPDLHKPPQCLALRRLPLLDPTLVALIW